MLRQYRVLSVLALVALAASLAVPLATTAHAQSTAALTIRVRSCPNGNGSAGQKAIDPGASCQAPHQAVSFSVDGGAARAVDADGSVTFTGLAAGSHRVTETQGPTIDFVTCGLRGSDQAVQVPSNASEFAPELSAGKESVCVSFNIGNPPTASLTIHARVCPNGDPTTNIFAACHANPLRTTVKFGIDSRGARSLDSHGNIRFRELDAGGHRLYLSGSLDNEAHVRIRCTRLGEITGSMTVRLRDDEQMTCDFYVIEAPSTR
jgi:hypothetical protein